MFGRALVVGPGVELVVGPEEDVVPIEDADEDVEEVGREVVVVEDSALNIDGVILILNPIEKPLKLVFDASLPTLSSLFSQASW